MRYIREDSIQIPIPDDWNLEIEALGWEAWAHSPDGEVGVREIAKTKEEALQRLKTRMYEWMMGVVPDSTR